MVWMSIPSSVLSFPRPIFHPVPLSIANNLLLMLLSLVFGNRWPLPISTEPPGFGRISHFCPHSREQCSWFWVLYSKLQLFFSVYTDISRFVSWKNEEFEPISERRFSVWQIREYSGCFVRTRPIITAISLTLTLWLEQTGKTRKRGSRTGNYAHKPKCARG